MRDIYTQVENGRYYADIEIATEEWKELLMDKAIFNQEALDMLRYWYEQIDQEASTKEIVNLYKLDRVLYNSLVASVGKKIKKRLNRFNCIGTDGNLTYWIIIFEGYESKRGFVWKLREEIVQAIDELSLFENSLVPNGVDEMEFIPMLEGDKKIYTSIRYERSVRNRNQAIRIHGTKCMICGFDFEEVYGDMGKNYIEVHHIRPLGDQKTEMAVDPKNDLICVCANCHRMIHRRRESPILPDELKSIVEDNLKRDRKS